MVEQHCVDTNDPQSSSQACYTNQSRTLKIPYDLVLGNHETSKGIEEFSINYISSGEVYYCSITIVNLCFSTVIAENFLNDPDHETMVECKKHLDWNKWKEAIEIELNLLKKRKMFTDLIPTPPKIFPVGFKWIFIQKRNKNNELVRYKVRLVAQGFTQRPDINFNETNSPVMNEITFWYLISLAI
jgi:hypothetical protein